jgi:hypothetical protein
MLKCRAVNKAFHCRAACRSFVLTSHTKGIQNTGQKSSKRSTAIKIVTQSISDRGRVTAVTAQCGQVICNGFRPRNPMWAGAGAPPGGGTLVIVVVVVPASSGAGIADTISVTGEVSTSGSASATSSVEMVRKSKEHSECKC